MLHTIDTTDLDRIKSSLLQDSVWINYRHTLIGVFGRVLAGLWQVVQNLLRNLAMEHRIGEKGIVIRLIQDKVRGPQLT